MSRAFDNDPPGGPQVLSTAATGVTAEVILEAIAEVGITHVVIVPDTHQRSVLERLQHTGPPVLRCATEADVMGVSAGLWMAGARPLVMIQQLGIYAGANSLRAFANEHQVPICMLAGLYARDVELPVEENPGSAVRLAIPILQVLGVRTTLIETAEQAPEIAPALAAAFEQGIASAVLLGAPTC
jgi:sulfopyruvate decarboxylase TPP-binding subunit